MSDFDSAMRKLTDVLYTAARKSGEILENTKVSYTVSGEKEKIVKLQGKIGAKVYQIYKDSASTANSVSLTEFIPDFEAIAAIEKTIAEMEKNVAAAKQHKICPECATKLPPESVYCPKCGEKLPVESTCEPVQSPAEPTGEPEVPQAHEEDNAE